MVWQETIDRLRTLAERQLFFIGGAPRSGTTWLQQIIDGHPDASCRGEGLFSKELFPRLEACMAERGEAISHKNQTLFRHTGGYPVPSPEDGAVLAGTVMLLGLGRQAAGRDCRAYGEKTPENVFYFERFLELFPRARFIGMARDPRDVITSAWYFFRRGAADEGARAAKLAFIREALPSLAEGSRAMLAFAERHPEAFRLVTYERLRHGPEPVVAGLFSFLDLADDAATVRACIDRASFEAATGGRPAGIAQDGAFLRRGVVGDWRQTLTAEMNDVILRELGWMFPAFGWQA